MKPYEYRLDLVTKYLAELNLADKIKSYFRDRTILVTGGAGAIGSNLVTTLSELVGDDGMIIVLDNLSAIKGDEPIDLPPLSNMMFVKGDVRSDIDLKRVFREKPTIVYHLAAFFANQNFIFRINLPTRKEYRRCTSQYLAHPSGLGNRVSRFESFGRLT